MAMAICKPSHCVFSDVAAPSSSAWRSHPAQHILCRLQSQNGLPCRLSWTRPSTSRAATTCRPFPGTVHGSQNQKKVLRGVKAEAGSESEELPQGVDNKYPQDIALWLAISKRASQYLSRKLYGRDVGVQGRTPNHLTRPLSKCYEGAAYFPKANFYKIEAVLRPWRLSHVASALIKMGIRGVTVSDVRGFGAQGGSRERQAGSEFSEDNFVTKVKMEVVVSEEQVEVVIDTVIEQARTGEIGDGKIFVSPISDIIRVRTGERGTNAERMVGGRSDLLSSMAPLNGNGY